MFRRGVPCFVVFDVLAANGRDLRGLSLLDRKKILRPLIPRRSAVVLYADSIDRRGCDFFGALS